MEYGSNYCNCRNLKQQRKYCHDYCKPTEHCHDYCVPVQSLSDQNDVPVQPLSDQNDVPVQPLSDQNDVPVPLGQSGTLSNVLCLAAAVANQYYIHKKFSNFQFELDRKETCSDGANLLAKGNVADAAELSSKVATAVAGDMWFQDDVFTANVFDGTAFQSSGSLRGPAGLQGLTGDQGATGYSFQFVSNAASSHITGVIGPSLGVADTGKTYMGTDNYTLYFWNGTQFRTSFPVRGAPGVDGADGSNGVDGADGADGADGSNLLAKGNVADAAALSSKVATAVAGDMWFQDDTFTANVYDGTAFQSSGSLRGPAGLQGLTGDQGVTGYSFQFIGNALSSLITGTIANGLGVADTGKTYMGTDNYNLYFWNGTSFDTSFPIRGAPGVDGADGSDGANLLAKGNVADAAALSSKVATAVVGDMWFQDDVYTANVFDGSAFQSSGSLRGPAGVAGANATIPTPTILTYEVASGTTGGQAPGINAWHTRPLNSLTNSSQNGGVSLSNNVITMGSTGLYKIEFMSVVFHVQNNKARLYRTNGITGTVGTGSSSKCATGGSGESGNIITANLAAGDQLELQHYVASTFGAADYGAPVSSGDAELYARVVIEKLA